MRGDALHVIGAGYWRKQKSAYENQKLNYTAEPADEGWKFAAGPALDHDQQMALGIPEPSVAGQMKVVRKPARPARINIRTTHETIAGFTGAGGGSRATLPDTGRQRAAHGREGELKLSLSRVG